MRRFFMLALLGLALAGCGTASRVAAPADAVLDISSADTRFTTLLVDWGDGVGYQPAAAPRTSVPEGWRGSKIVPGVSAVGIARLNTGALATVVAVEPFDRPGQCWLRLVESWQGNRLKLRFGTAEIDPARSRMDGGQRAVLYPGCRGIPWMPGSPRVIH